MVRPARSANVAAACRALKNMGLRRLCLVGTSVAAVDPEARALAYGAWDVLDGARSCESLKVAVAESALVVGTTGREIAGAWTPWRFAAEAGARSRGRVSVVFGPEASGLTGSELDVCHALVHVPTEPEHPSLNLAQAVLLLAYELRLVAIGAERGPGGAIDAPPGEPSVSAGELEDVLQGLREALVCVGYLDAANPERILTELRRLLARASLTRREATLLRGLARQVLWAGGVAKSRSANG